LPLAFHVVRKLAIIFLIVERQAFVSKGFDYASCLEWWFA